MSCIIGKGYKSGKGYPVKQIAGKQYNISRLVIGEQLMAGEVVRHTCDNPSCINPLHLTKGTHADNMEDKRRRGRAAKKLSQTLVDAIYRDQRPQRTIALEYGVAQPTVSKIKRGLTWRDTAKDSNEQIRGG